MQGPARSRWRRRFAALALVVLLTGAPSLAVGEPGGEATTLASQRVRIVDFAFRPRTVTIARGTRVRWVNAGAVTHTTTSTRGLWDSGSLAPGETFRRVFRKAGTFRYLCTVHATMRGRIVVS